jgi:signal transduction histidine kinase
LTPSEAPSALPPGGANSGPAKPVPRSPLDGAARASTGITGTRRWRRRLKHSLGLRLVALFLALALAMTAVFLYGMQRALSSGWSVVLRPLVADYVDHLARDIGSPPDVARAQALAKSLPLSVRIEGPQVQFDSHPRRWSHRHDQADGIDDGSALLTRTTADGHRISFGLGDTGWAKRPRTIGWITLTALLLLTALAYAYVRHLFRPLNDIHSGALRFGQGRFDTPIPVRRHDELGELATQVNTMAHNIHGMLDAKRGLLLAVSHELRSPLTRARLNAELVADGNARDALLRDLGTMRDLISDLLESERLAAGHAALHAEATDLNALVRSLVGAQFASAHLQLDLADALPLVKVDAVRIQLLLRNLLDNALRHSVSATAAPQVGTSVEGDRLRLAVRDFGPGIDAAQLPHLSEAFYRPDSARQRNTGGIGLGLYLCRLVAHAHGGTLEIDNAQPGLRVTLRLPLKPAAAVRD